MNLCVLPHGKLVGSGGLELPFTLMLLISFSAAWYSNQTETPLRSEQLPYDRPALVVNGVGCGVQTSMIWL